MKVVFLETVEGSGAMGDIRDVANGFARNYLLPRGYAAPATPQLIEQAAELAQIEGERQRVEDERAHGLVGKLENATLVMTVRVGEQGRLYGSVTSADIAEKAGEILGEELDRRRVLLPEVIRNVGLFPVTLRLSRNIAAEVNVAVVDAETPEGVDAAVEQLLAPPVMEEPEPEATPAEEESDVTETDDVSEQGKNELDGEEAPDEASAEASADVAAETSDASDEPASTDDAEADEAASDDETEEAVTE
ncbi:MAG TPA: 50S ribosomal protein L9 [Dehalococcoidia bacterium]|nr:50S ribosomal protein L9 [Vicinamibacterales bacterium]HJM89608.1 50S ribosomal protein L9 [Dehalococcoidia bacterium]